MVDMDNLDKYYGKLSDAQLRNEMLFELLRSAAHEHARVNKVLFVVVVVAFVFVILNR
jgi:hypothetical protein